MVMNDTTSDDRDMVGENGLKQSWRQSYERFDQKHPPPGAGSLLYLLPERLHLPRFLLPPKLAANCLL